MTSHTVPEAFAAAAARLTRGNDAAGSLLALLRDCAWLMDADAVGILIVSTEERLELLSSTSHTATVLELYELQNGRGPCVEAVRTNAVISAAMPELIDRWVPVGPALVDAGYRAVQAFPLRWQDQAVGALNVFNRRVRPLDSDHEQLGQAFANMAVAVLAQPSDPSWTSVQERVARILTERVAIEQAKGVLAVQNNIGVADAFIQLVESAERRGVPLSDQAADVLASVYRSDPASS